jgi:hypothetical protein
LAAKALLEPLFRVGAPRPVAEDERQAIRAAFGVGERHAADAARPTGLLLAGRRRLDHDSVEGFAREHALHRVRPRRRPVVSAPPQPEALPVFGHGAAEVRHRADAMHLESRVVGPSYGLVRLDEDHPVAQRRGQLQQPAAAPARSRGSKFLGHRRPSGQARFGGRAFKRRGKRRGRPPKLVRPHQAEWWC